jgi:uncharacterized damage-inducible protein DinB
MKLSEALLVEFDQEVEKTKKTLERIPDDSGFKPHAKSMSLGALAAHIAELAGFGETVVTTPMLEFSSSTYKPLPFESAAQLVAVSEEGAAKLRKAMAGLADSAWDDTWRLVYEGNTIFSGSRFLAYREMFLNHLVHHRAQLGVYLRLKDVAVPGIYGPSADEQWKG